jgi:hypothetical protein
MGSSLSVLYFVLAASIERRGERLVLLNCVLFCDLTVLFNTQLFGCALLRCPFPTVSFAIGDAAAPITGAFGAKKSDARRLARRTRICAATKMAPLRCAQGGKMKKAHAVVSLVSFPSIFNFACEQGHILHARRVEFLSSTCEYEKPLAHIIIAEREERHCAPRARIETCITNFLKCFISVYCNKNRQTAPATLLFNNGSAARIYVERCII